MEIIEIIYMIPAIFILYTFMCWCVSSDFHPFVLFVTTIWIMICFGYVKKVEEWTKKSIT